MIRLTCAAIAGLMSTRKLKRAVRLPEGDLPIIAGAITCAPLKSQASRCMFCIADRRMKSMKLGLIALGLVATTGVVYAACLFC